MPDERFTLTVQRDNTVRVSLGRTFTAADIDDLVRAQHALAAVLGTACSACDTAAAS